MPASYTHYSFGSDVYKNLSKAMRDIIDKNRTAYNIGLNGPDILFYYKPMIKNQIKNYGNEMHYDTAYHFFKNAKNVIRKNRSDISISYILGFICHFILDSNCHPYINIAMKEIELSHETIEAELDGYLMRRNGIDPKVKNAGEHVIPSWDIANNIYLFYEDVTAKQIYRCLKAVRFYNSFITCESNIKRGFIKGILKNVKGGINLSNMIINVTPEPKCKAVVEDLINLYQKSIEEAVEIINIYYNELFMDIELNKRFNSNFVDLY